jgi:hypothetical protein
VTAPLWLPASAPNDGGASRAALEELCHVTAPEGRGGAKKVSGGDEGGDGKEAKLMSRLPCSLHEQTLVAHAAFGPHPHRRPPRPAAARGGGGGGGGEKGRGVERGGGVEKGSGVLRSRRAREAAMVRRATEQMARPTAGQFATRDDGGGGTCRDGVASGAAEAYLAADYRC